MDPLKRNNPGVRATDHEDRIQTLERRIFPYGLKWATTGSLSAQTIDSDAEYAIFDPAFFRTNDEEMFEEDPSNDGIIVNTHGFYMISGMIETGSAATARQTYTQAQPVSSYPLFGVEFGQGAYALDTSLIDDTNVRQNHQGFGQLLVDDNGPYKVVLVAVRLGGVNYNTSRVGLVIVNLGTGAV
jgi:hypothetical protein